MRGLTLHAVDIFQIGCPMLKLICGDSCDPARNWKVGVCHPERWRWKPESPFHLCLLSQVSYQNPGSTWPQAWPASPSLLPHPVDKLPRLLPHGDLETPLPTSQQTRSLTADTHYRGEINSSYFLSDLPGYRSQRHEHLGKWLTVIKKHYCQKTHSYLRNIKR